MKKKKYYNIFKIAIVSILFITCYEYSFTQTQQSYPILGITVEGNQLSDGETIISLSGLRPGDQIKIPSDDKLQTALRNLWKRHQFSDVSIVVDKITPSGIFLVIKVKEFPRLSEIKVENNDKISEKDLVKEVGKMRGDILSSYDVYLAKLAIKRAYSKEGMLFAKVESEIQPTDTANYSRLNLIVNEGFEYHTASIEFIGNKAFDNGDLEGSFKKTHTKHWWQFWRSSKFDKKEYEEDKENLKKFFKTNGYIDAELIKDSMFFNEDKEEVYLKLWVTEGNKIYLRNVTFDGNTVYPTGILNARLGFEPGEAYNLEKFEQNLRANEDQTDVSSLYMDNGYLSVRLEKTENRFSPDSADVTVKIYEGERITIRKVDIVGNTKTKDKVIRRELYTRPGDYFSRSAIIRSIKALGVLQYFNPEALQTGFTLKPVPTDNTKVDLVYKVEEQSTDTFNASLGFAGTYGLTGAVGMTFNNFSLTDPLKGGGGQVLNFSAEFGQASRYRTFSLGFSEPWLFDEPTTVGFNIFDTHQNYIYDISRTGISLNVGRRFRWPDDYFRGDWSVRIERDNVQTTNVAYYRPGITTELSLTQTFSRTSLNNIFFPTSGSRFSYSISTALAALGLGTTDYIKNEVNFEIYNPLIQIKDYDRLVLYLGSKFGYVAGFKSDTAISPIELYYMGGNGLGVFGVTPLRGYQDREIGPQYGGRVMAKYTAELRFAVAITPMPIYIYGFAEAGNVWENLRLTDPFDLKRSAGIGIQLMINPIGIIGFSYGYGFDVDRTGKRSGWNFLFHLGQ